MSVNCGLYAPRYEDRIELGIEHRTLHPNHARHEDLVEGRMEDAAPEDRIGTRIILPDSTPKDHWFDGEIFSFSERTRGTVRKVKQKAPGLHCVTYAFHGRRSGSYRQWQRGAWGIDMPLSRFHQKANAAEEEAGDRLTYWMVRNWDWLNLNYLIWWNWMIEHPTTGWFDYEPWRSTGSGSQELVTSRHLDHAHAQVDNPHVAGNN